MSSVCRAPTRYLLAKTIDIDVVQYAVTTDAILNTWIAIVLPCNLNLSLFFSLSLSADSKQQTLLSTKK